MSAKLNIVNTFENSTKKPIVFLLLIGLAGLFLRLVYFPYDVPLLGDSSGYLWYAIDMSILNQLPSGHIIVNTGWPSFLSIIFQLMDSNNFIELYQVIITYATSIILGVASFIPAGIGVFEGTLIGLLSIQGLTISSAISLTIFVRVFTLWYSVLVGFFALKFSGALSLNSD